MKHLYLILLIAVGCSSKPEIHHGHDECSYCRMTISDARFSTAIVTEKGKVFKYDDLSCLDSHGIEGQRYVSLFVEPNTLKKIEDVELYYDKNLRSPMGGNTAARER